MSMITLRDGARIQVADAGHGTPLMLISGLGGTLGFWDRLVDALGRDLRTLRFDQRGIAGSERGSAPVTIRTLAEDAWQIVDARALERPVLCGHSTGGAIVQEMALQRPGAAAGLVLSGSWAGPNPYMDALFTVRLNMLAHLPSHYAELAALLASPPRWLRDNPHVLQQAASQVPDDTETAITRERIEALLAHDCRDRLAEITTATLVLGAEDDMIVPAYLQEELDTQLAVSHLHVFDKGGHFFPVTRPDETADVLRNWLTERAT